MLNVILVFLVFLVLSIMYFVDVHIFDKKPIYTKPKRVEITPAFSEELYCMVENKPVIYIDFHNMSECSPLKCRTCKMSVFRDI